MDLVIKEPEEDTFKFNSGPNNNGLYHGAKGGTEQMYEGLVERLDPKILEQFQIICSRVRELDPNKKKILWLHDYYRDPEVSHLKSPESRERFSKLVFVSQHQFTTYNVAHGVPFSESTVLKNAIIPFPEVPKPTDRINIIYHTTPHRGLELLVPAFLEIVKMVPNIHLDVYSSFNIYGWGERDRPYEHLFNICKDHPNISYHGAVPNAQVREALNKAHIFAYPSIWPETSCLAAIEALCAGCAVVAPDYGALPETIGQHGFMYRWSEDKQEHLNRFANILYSVIVNYSNDRVQTQLINSRKQNNVFYSWNYRIREWETLLEGLLNGSR